ncbi:MAG: hypothetical protein M1839_005352 [Geoglossum umbratile]|nr:MAG: hypothetical protein M1839_005352 [Geoglossum umbratile]
MSLRHSSRHFRVQKRDSRSRAHTTHTKTTATKVTKNSRPRDANYQQRLIDSGIYPLGHLLPNGRRPPLPPNWKEIKRRLAKRRSSISPSRFSKKRHRNFVREDEKAFNEDDVKDSIIPVMLKAAGAFRRAKKNILFMNIAPIAPHISQAKPDYYYGARPGQIHLSVRNDEQLSKHITPSKHTHLPVVPNFSLEAKGPHGTTAEALLQACHNGVVGARAVHSLNTYGQDQPIYNNDLYAISSFYLGGVLKMYGHSVAQPNGRGTQPEYCMHKLGGWEMTSNRDTFLKGVTVFKNAMDLTKEYRDVAIAHANEHATDREENIDDEESAEDKEGTEDEESTGDGENIEDEEL